MSLPTQCTAKRSGTLQSISAGISNVPELCVNPRGKSCKGDLWERKAAKKICVWAHQQEVKQWRKELTTTWLTWILQWSTKMEKRKHYSKSTKQCRWKTSRIKTSKLYATPVATSRLLQQPLVHRWKRPSRVRWLPCTWQIQTVRANWTKITTSFQFSLRCLY